jgi:hypothetical protein
LVTQLFLDASGWLRRAEIVFCSIVDNYAFAEAIANDDYQDAYVTNDFFYYCFTKSTKSLIAINLLIRAHLGEDAQILLRSTYENYLAASFLFANPTRLDDLVEKKIGAHTGYFKHPVNSKGRKDRRRIVDPRSGQVIPFDVPIAEMVSTGRYPEDKDVHWPLYAFLSEHVHPHMMASGNYRAESQIEYSYQDPDQAIQAAIFGTYIYLLLLGEVRYFEDLDRGDLVRTTKLLRAGAEIVERTLALMKFEHPMETLPSAIRARIATLVATRKSNRSMQPTRQRRRAADARR